MRVLFIAGSSNPLFDRLLKELETIKFEVQLYKTDNISGKSRVILWLKLLSLATRDFIKILRYDVDLVSIQFFSVRNYLVSIMLAVFRVNYSISFWGSDYVSLSKRKYPFIKFILKNSKFLSFNNRDYMAECERVFSNVTKICELRFGLGLLDDIDDIVLSESSEAGVAERKKVMIGTNASPNQQHLKLIEVLDSHCELLNDFEFVFHMSYGDRRNRELVKTRLRDANFKSKVDESFYTGAELAQFRLKTDILVQLQENDALSGAMQETIYAGGVVITGSWLPYDLLRDRGISWIEVDTLNDLSDALIKAKGYRPDVNRNREIIRSVSSWKKIVIEWAEAFRSTSGIKTES
ncbi:hypothetical protein [Marinobacter guineae]|uniref:hypothetical protein n=1 Tax=Marinobacter guineae TaxID=432303 RepID=UPI00117D9ABA|nr:hypothetical protein [Marinobacter guineae]